MVREGETAWVPHSWFDWPDDGYSTSESDRWRALRPYDNWALAEKLMATPGSTDTSRGAIARELSLTVDRRLRHLDDLYSLKAIGQILGSRQRRQLTAVLGDLEVVRPRLLNELRQLRNTIEHRDALAPSSQRCAELIDLVWYFLRATDSLAFRVHTDWTFQEPDVDGKGERWVCLSYRLPDWDIGLYGRFDAAEVSAVERVDHLRIVLKEDARDLGNGIVYLVGEVSQGGPGYQALVREYFGLQSG